MTEQVLARIVEMALEARGVQSAGRIDGSTTVGDLDLDSLEVVQFFLSIEDEFRVNEDFLGNDANQPYPLTTTLAEIAQKVVEAQTVA